MPAPTLDPSALKAPLMWIPKMKTLYLLLALTSVACTPVPDGLSEADDAMLDDAELDDPDVTPTDERDGVSIPSATFERHADPAMRAHIEEIRSSTCDQDARVEAPTERLSPPLARGLTEPRFRVTEDQAQASRDALTDADPSLPAVTPDDRLIDAQARYLSRVERLAAEGLGSEPEQQQARAALKAELLGDD